MVHAPAVESGLPDLGAGRGPVRSPRSRARIGYLVAALLGGWLPAALARGDGATPDAHRLPPPIGWREPSPVARLFLQPPFETPEVLPRGLLELEVNLLYSNSLLSARTDTLALDVQVETAQPTLSLRYGLLPGVECQLAIPLVDDHGGLLDGTIVTVEDMFGAWNEQRRGRPHRAAYFRLTRPDGSGVDRPDGGTGLGDVFGGLKVRLAGSDGDGGTLSMRGLVKFPTGRLPYGSEELDLGASLLAGWRWATRAVRLELDALVPTERLPRVHLRTHPYGAVQLGITQRMGERVGLQAQVSGHLSPLAGTGLSQLDGRTFYLLGGATFALGRDASDAAMELAVVENVFSPYRGADITFLFAYRSSR